LDSPLVPFFPFFKALSCRIKEGIIRQIESEVGSRVPKDEFLARSDSFFLFLFQKREKKEKEEEYLRPCKRDRVLGRIKDLPTAVERDLVTSTLSKVASWKRMKR
jgi:hypothetical protein